LRVEHRLRVFKNRVLMKVFGHEGQDIIGDRRKLHNEEQHGLYSSSSSSSFSSSSSSIDSTTLGGSWSVQQFYSTPFYPPLSPSNQ
jgi:hypothetical protein